MPGSKLIDFSCYTKSFTVVGHPPQLIDSLIWKDVQFQVIDSPQKSAILYSKQNPTCFSFNILRL